MVKSRLRSAEPAANSQDLLSGTLLGDAEPAARAVAEVLRRTALGLAAALIVARAYWPAEFRSEEDSGGGLLWALLMLAVAFMGVASQWLGGGLRVRRSWADVGVIALVALVALSASHAAERRIAINLAWEWVGVGIAYLAIRNLPRGRAESQVLVGAFLATAVALSLYGRYQVDREHPQLREKYQQNARAILAQAGMDPDLKPDDPERIRLEDRLLGSREPNATFALANTLAGFLVGPATVGLAIFLRASSRRETRKLGTLALALAPILIVLSCLLLTKSRSAYVGLLAALVLLAWGERKRVPPRTLALGMGAVVTLLVVLVALATVTGRLDRQVLTESTKSLSYRAEYWRGAWGVISEGSRRWVTGVGPGNFAEPYLGHKLPRSSEEIADPHNMLLDVWATAGLPALLALLVALGVGLRASFGPSKPLPSLVEPEEAEAPRTATWLIMSAGLGGWILVAALGQLNPFQEDLSARWVVLGVGWLLAVGLGRPLMRLQPVSSDVLGLGVLSVAINLLAAGGIAYSPVSLVLWGFVGLSLNLREDRPCSVRRMTGGRGTAFLVAAILAAIVGTYFGTVPPHGDADRLIREAETVLTNPVADPVRAEMLYKSAIEADPLASRARIAYANLEFREWQRRGRPVDDFAWHRINSGLLSAMKPPLNPRSLLVQRLRARFAREFLDLPNLPPAERLKIRNDRLDACLAACDIYPTDATLRAELAEAQAESDHFPQAIEEGQYALELDRGTPHLDKKLRDNVRTRLQASLKKWAEL